MRFKGLLFGDIHFQFKYGFYYLYAFLSAIYIAILMLVPEIAITKVMALLIFTDPVSLGLIFIGAMILLEKSEYVIASLAVSPVKIGEYVVSKALSLCMISTLTSIIIAGIFDASKLIFVFCGVLLGSFLFSLIGIFIAAKAKSLNQFIAFTTPAFVIFMFPAIAESLSDWKSPLLWLNPGNAILRLIEGNVDLLFLSLLVTIVWIVFMYVAATRAVCKIFRAVGGIDL